MRYTYKCENKKCNHEFDVKMGMNEEHPTSFRCEECGKKAKKLFTNAIHIPHGWGENRMKFNKSPSGKKHYY